jgi:hypothetical protein
VSASSRSFIVALGYMSLETAGRMLLFYIVVSLAGFALAAVSISDPSDVISPLLWAADNALPVDFNVPFISVQPEDIPAAYTFEKNSTSINHEAFSTNLNDTTVILVANGAEINLSFVDIEKLGYASNLLWSSFYGFNAAVNIVSLIKFATKLK